MTEHQERVKKDLLDLIKLGIRSAGYVDLTDQELAEVLNNQPKSYWVTNHDAPEASKKVAGPFTTSSDAGMAREILERFEQHHNYWIEQIPEANHGRA